MSLPSIRAVQLFPAVPLKVVEDRALFHECVLDRIVEWPMFELESRIVTQEALQWWERIWTR